MIVIGVSYLVLQNCNVIYGVYIYIYPVSIVKECTSRIIRIIWNSISEYEHILRSMSCLIAQVTKHSSLLKQRVYGKISMYKILLWFQTVIYLSLVLVKGGVMSIITRTQRCETLINYNKGRSFPSKWNVMIVKKVN